MNETHVLVDAGSWVFSFKIPCIMVSNAVYYMYIETIGGNYRGSERITFTNRIKSK